jgi:hypothetical protein
MEINSRTCTPLEAEERFDELSGGTAGNAIFTAPPEYLENKINYIDDNAALKRTYSIGLLVAQSKNESEKSPESSGPP